MICTHNWQPHPSANARYRCAKCYAFGHKPALRGCESTSTSITEYRCKKCSSPAVQLGHRVRAGTWRSDPRCSQHKVKQ